MAIAEEIEKLNGLLQSGIFSFDIPLPLTYNRNMLSSRNKTQTNESSNGGK